MNFSLSSSHALLSLAQAQPGGGALFAQLLPLILIFVVFWFLLIRPQMKRAREHQSMTSSLRRGDKVVTGGGLYGKVVRAVEGEDTIDVEIAPDVQVKIARTTIAANISASSDSQSD